MFHCVITIFLVHSYAALDDVAEPVDKLYQKLQELQVEFNETLAKVVETIKRNRPASRPTILTNQGRTNKTDMVSSLQNRMDKVGKLLHTVADCK